MPWGTVLVDIVNGTVNGIMQTEQAALQVGVEYSRTAAALFQERSEAPKWLVDELDRVVTELEALTSG